jgi:enoyl-CoA hydratase
MRIMDLWTLQREKAVATLSLNNPPKNFLNLDVMRTLIEVLNEIEADRTIHVVIIKSSIQDAFISGADVKIFHTADEESIFHFSDTGRQALQKLEELSTPVICQIDGACLGGGCELALCCDIRIASENARFGQPEIIYGLIPGAGGIQRMSRLLSKGQAMKLLFTGFTLKAEEAYRIGLIDELVSPGNLERKTRKISRRIASLAPGAVQTMKKLIRKGQHLDLETAITLDTGAFREIIKASETKAKIHAFFNRRFI